jgi:hypothetical protein
MKKILAAIFLFVAILQSANAQTLSDPAYANMQRAMGGIIQNVAAARGYSSTDPRIYNTLYGMGTTATTAAASAGAGLLIGGTAPAWATVLGMAAISGAVSYGVGLGIDKLVNWYFGTPSTTPITVSAPPSALAPSAIPATLPNTIPYSYACPNLATILPNAVGQAYYYVCYTSPRYYLNSIWLTSIGSPAPATGYTNAGTYSTYTVWNGPSTALTSSCPTNYSLNGSNCVSQSSSSSSSNITLNNQTLSQAVSALATAQQTTAVNQQTMAMMLNYLWQQAAAQPGYAGLPYTNTSPITTTDVANYQTSNPSAYPNIGNLVATVPSGSSGLYPSTTSVAGSPVTPASTVNSSSTVNPSTTQQINLGADPATPAPTLEQTPTAQMILAPIFALFPSFQSYVVPAHNSECPTGSFTAFNSTFTLDVHCSLFQTIAPTLQSVMLLVFALASLIIILKA